MPSKVALREHRKTAAVLAAGRRHRDVVVTTLLDRLAADGALDALEATTPTLEEPVIAAQTVELSEAESDAVIANLRVQAAVAPVRLPDLDNLHRVGIWMIAHYTARMMAADAQLRQERQEDYVAKQERDEAYETAHESLVRLRRYVVGVLDEESAAALLDLDSGTPRNAYHLRDTLNVVVKRLRNPQTHFPKAHFESTAPNWDRLADELDVVLLPLVEAIHRVEDEETASEEALRERRRVFEQYRVAVSGWRMMLRGMAFASGDRELVGYFQLPTRPRRADDGEEDDFEIDLPDDVPVGDLPLPVVPEDGESSEGSV